MARKSAASQVGLGLGNGKPAPSHLFASDSDLSSSRLAMGTSDPRNSIPASKPPKEQNRHEPSTASVIERSIPVPTPPTATATAPVVRSANRTQMELSRDQQQREQNLKAVESRKRAREVEERDLKKQLPRGEEEESDDSDTSSDEERSDLRGAPQPFQRDTVKRSLGLLFLADDDEVPARSSAPIATRVQQSRSANLVSRAKDSHQK
jgi:hypothetical protein